jgi:hypothetical protein
MIVVAIHNLLRLLIIPMIGFLVISGLSAQFRLQLHNIAVTGLSIFGFKVMIKK